jgi:hypothetical protein
MPDIEVTDADRAAACEVIPMFCSDCKAAGYARDCDECNASVNEAISRAMRPERERAAKIKMALLKITDNWRMYKHEGVYAETDANIREANAALGEE